MSVMSVSGPVGGGALGRTLVHEHIVISTPGEELDPQEAPDRREIVAIAVDELQKLKDHGVSTLVDPCPMELGRDPELYAEVAQKSGVSIVFATGFYMEAMGIPTYWRARDADEIADLYLKELTDGVGKTGLRPGVIKAATGMEVTENEEKCLTGAAMAQRQAGCAIITHTEHSRHGERQQDIFAENGADLSRILIGHQDEHPSPEPLVALAKRGTFVGIDRIGVDFLAPDETRADNVAAVVAAGFGGRMCLSHDCVCALTAPRYPFAVPKERRPAGGPKEWAQKRKPMTHLLTDFLPRLKTRGVTEAQIDTMLRDNPRRLLTGEA
jgi:phosphotriesterase-related protein